MPARPNALADWPIRWRWPLLLVGAALVAGAWFPARRLEFDRRIENMFAPDDPLLAPYRRLKRTFGGNEIVVVAYVDPELMTPEGIERVARLSGRLDNVPAVRSVLSLTSTPLGKGIIEPSGVAAPFLELLENYAVDQARQTAAFVCVLDPDASTDEQAAAVHRLREIAEAHDPPASLAGEPVMVVEGFRLIEQDGQRLGLISTALLTLCILLCFRSLRWVIVPLAVVNATLLWTEGLLVLSRMRLSMVSSMLWAIVTVIGVATVVHVIVHVRENRQAGAGPREALRQAIAVLALPVLWTCMTDAAGFASLLTTSVGPIRDFGKMMVLGSLLALPALVMFVPGLALAGARDGAPRQAWGEAHLAAGLRWLLQTGARWRKSLVAATALVLALALGGLPHLEVETDFTRNFRADSPLVESYELVESRLRGAGVWDILVPAPESPTPEFLDSLRRLEKRLREEVTVRDAEGNLQRGLTKTLSLADALDAAPQVSIPFVSEDRVLAMKLSTFRAAMPDVADALWGQDPRDGQWHARIMLRSRERQPAESKQRLISEVRRIAREEFPATDSRGGAEVTGFFVLLANLISSLIRDQWVAFGLAAAAIFAMMWLAFRSLRIAVAAIVPNALPILVITGAMGWLTWWGVEEARLNMAAAMIAGVSVGLSVDSSIHYISAWRRHMSAGESPTDALEKTQQSVGRAASFSTLALIVGFSALTTSDFVPTIYFGALVSLAMLGGLLGNILLLPILLGLFQR